MTIDTIVDAWFVLLAVATPISIAATSVLYFPLISLYLLLGAWSFRRWPPSWGKVETAFAVFWLISLVSALHGWSPWDSRVRLGKDLYFLILVLMGGYLGREDRRPFLLKIFMATTVGTAAFGILQRLIGVDQSSNKGGVFFHLPTWLAHAPRGLQDHLSMVVGRVVGTRAHPLTYAEGLLFALAYTLAVLAGRKSAWRGWALAQVAVMLALVFSQSRGPWIAAGVMVIVACVLRPRPTFFKRLALVYLPVLLCFLAPSLRSRVFSIANKTYGANAERLEMWQAGKRMIAEHPLLGIGTGMMPRASPQYQSDARRSDGPWGHLHSTYVNLAAERGMLGLGAFLTFIGLLAAELYRGFRLALAQSEAESEIVVLAALLSLVGWLVAGLTETVNHDSNVLMMFYFVMGVGLATSRRLLKNL